MEPLIIVPPVAVIPHECPPQHHDVFPLLVFVDVDAAVMRVL